MFFDILNIILSIFVYIFNIYICIFCQYLLIIYSIFYFQYVFILSMFISMSIELAGLAYASIQIIIIVKVFITHLAVVSRGSETQLQVGEIFYSFM